MKVTHTIVNCEGNSGDFIHLANDTLRKLKPNRIEGSVYTFSSYTEDPRIPAVKVTVITRTAPYVTDLEFECDAERNLNIAGTRINQVKEKVSGALDSKEFYLS